MQETKYAFFAVRDAQEQNPGQKQGYSSVVSSTLRRKYFDKNSTLDKGSYN